MTNPLNAIRRFFRTRSFESIVGLLMAFGALLVATLSLWQSCQANRNVERANRFAEESVAVSKDALDFSRKSEELKSEPTLQIGISTSFPPILSIAPTSAEFVLSDTHVVYVHHEQTLQSAYADLNQPGIHDLSPIYERLAEMFATYERSKTDSEGSDWSGSSVDQGYFPVLIHVEYSLRGVSIYSGFLYELYYERWNSSAQEHLPNGYTRLRKPRLVRKLADDEDAEKALSDLFERWRKEHLPNDAEWLERAERVLRTLSKDDVP